MKKRSLSLGLFLAFIMTSVTNAQVGSNDALAGSDRQTILSPTAASLSAYGELPVNYFRGIPNVSIPIFSFKERGLPVFNISLSYNSEATRTTDIPDWVGQGWSLNAGGVITRVVNGKPDELTGGFIFTKNQLATPGNMGSASFFTSSILTGLVDSAPDDFYFNFAGLSGQLFLDQNISGDIDVRTFPQRPIKVEFLYGSDIWKITDENGILYTFEKTETTPWSTCASCTPTNVTSSWYLTKIESPSSSGEISITYSNQALTSYTTPLIEEKFVFAESSIWQQTPSDINLSRNANIQRRFIESISSDRYVIDFTKSARDDNSIFSGEKKLDQITIKNKSSQTIKSFNFDYEYCPSFSCSGVSDKRLFLKELTEKDAVGSSLPSFKMEYNSTVIPRPTSKSVDHWGYYNGKSNTTFIPTSIYYNSVFTEYQAFIGADRTPHSTLSQAGILTKVTYPTGGYTSFEYEPHTFSELLKVFDSPKDIEKRQLTTLSDFDNTSGIFETSTFSISGSSSKPSAVIVNAIVEYCESGFPCSGTPLQGVPTQLVRIINTATQATVYTTDSWETETIFLSNGNYRLEVNMITLNPSLFNTVSGTLTIYEEKTYTNRTGGGNRIKKMITHDGVDAGNNIIKTFEYEFSGTSTGAVFFQPNYMHEGVGYISLSSKPIQLGGSLKHLGYNKVRVNHGNQSQYGYEEHTFNLPMSTSLLTVKDLEFFRFEKDSYLYGQKLKAETFDELGNRKTSLQNLYYDSSNDATPSSLIYKELPHFSYKSVGGTLLGACSSAGCTIGTNKYFYTYSFNQRIPWVYQSESIQKAYDGTDELTTRKKFFYDDYTHLQTTKIEETNSLTAEKRSTIFEYANEVYNSTGGMLEKNMLTQPYSVLVEDGSGNDLSKSWTIWSKTISGTLNGAWLPKEQWTWKGTGTAPGVPTTSIAIKNSEVTEYDSFGNPIQVVDAAGLKNISVWSEDKLVPVGTFRNAEVSDVYAYSFAYEDDLGDWVFKDRLADGGTVIDINDGKIRLYDSNGLNGDRDRVLYRHPSELSGTVVWEFDVQIANSDNWGLLMGTGGSSWNDWSAGGSECAVWAAINDEVFYYRDPVSATYISAKDDLVIGQTYSFKFVMDSDAEEIEYYIDGELVGTGDYQKTSSGIQELILSNFGHTTLSDPWYIDNIRFYRQGTQAQTQEIDPLFGVPLSIKDISGSVNRFEYDSFGRLNKTYNANGELVSTNNYYYSLDGNTSYNAADPNYVETLTHYDPANSSNVTKSISYLDGLGREIQAQVRGGSKTLITGTRYNERGLPEATSRPIEKASQTTFLNNLFDGTGSFDPVNGLGNNSEVEAYYDNQGLGLESDHAFTYTQYESSPLARAAKTALPGYAWRLSSGKEITTTYRLNATETFATTAVTGLVGAKSWAANMLTKTISEDPSGNKTITYTNGWGQTIASGVDMDNNSKLDRTTSDLVTEFAYDERGNLVLEEDPRGLQTKYWYNTLGQLTKKNLPDQDEANSYCYDDKGRLRYHRDPNQVANVTYYLGSPQYDYHYTKYDELDRPTETGEKDGLGNYDTACSASANNQTVPSSYHTPKVYYSYDGTNAYSGANNLKGRLTKVRYLESTGSWGETWYSYNNLGLVEWVVQKVPGITGDIKITYTYDELGRQTEMGYNVTNSSDDHYYWYEYDELGRLEYVYSDTDSNPTGRIKEAEYTSYSADGQIAQMKLGNGNIQTVNYTYTVQGWLNKLNGGTVSSGANGDRFALDLDYAYNGNISLQKWMQSSLSTTNSVQYAYTYDKANRLTAANYTNNNSLATDDNNNGYDISPISYDENGNIASIIRKGQGSSAYPANSITSTTIAGGSNRMTSYGLQNGPTPVSTKTVTYDANGNMLQNRFTSGVYNDRNLMTSVQSGTTTIQFGYDEDGNRVRKEVVGGVESTYVRGADGQTIAVYENGSRAFVNLLGGGQMLGTYDGSQRRYFLKDHLGTVRTTVDQTGAVDGYDDYFPFGLVMSGRSDNTANPDDLYKFTGHERDDEASLNLDYMMARNYDPVIGRFLQIDPLSDQFPGWAPYHYVYNNPLNFTDPSGMNAITAHLEYVNGEEYVVLDQGDTIFDVIRLMNKHGISSLQFEEGGDFFDENGYGIEGGRAKTGRTFNDIPAVTGTPPIPGGSFRNANRLLNSGAAFYGTLAFLKGRRATLTIGQLFHIIRRHSFGTAPRAGKFSKNLSLAKLERMIQKTVARGTSRPGTSGRPGMIYELDLGRTIGVNISGKTATKLRVIVVNGIVKTAFPY